jgi:inosine/guanosine/xanthosine phosphorylase family protein
MLFSDHINLIGVNPLRGLPVDDGRCFVDLSDTYCAALRLELQAAAREEGIPLHEGVYLGVSGPSYETPAEIRAFRIWGADAVGMSTIPEALMGRYCGLNVAAVSCITNRAAGIGPGKLSHEEVLGAGEANAANAARLFGRFASRRKAGVKP